MITTPYEKIQNDLRSIPKDQLMSMGNNPSPQYPPYMIATEMQRRVQDEKAMAAQQTRDQAGQPTVVEGVMDEFANTGGLSQAQPMMAMNQEVPPDGIQMMATGGPVGYQNGKRVGYQQGKQLQFLKSLGISEQDLDNYFKRQQIGRQSGIQYSPEIIEQIAPSQLEQIQRDIISNKSSGIRDDFYETVVNNSGKESIDVQKRFGKGFLGKGFGGGQNLMGSYLMGISDDVSSPTLFPEDQSFGFLTGRQKERDYFTGAGAKNMEDISTFIAGNRDAYAAYQKAGGGQSGIDAVINAGLLGDVDALTGMPKKANSSAFNIENYIQKYSTENVKKLRQADPTIIQELDTSKIPPKRTSLKDLSTIKQILGVQEKIGTDTSGYDTFNAPDYTGLRRNRTRGDIYKEIRENLELADYNTEDILTGLEGMVDQLPEPDYEAPTESERQSELSGMGLALLGKAIGGAKNLGEAAVTIGEGVPEIGKLKKEQRDEANAILAMDRAMATEALNHKTNLAKLDLQYKNADNTTKIQVEGMVANEIAMDDAFNQHHENLRLNYDKMEFAHKELLATIGFQDRDAAIAIVKLDQLKAQSERLAEGTYRQNLTKTYELLLDNLEQIQKDGLMDEGSAGKITRINRELDRILSTLLNELGVSGTTTDGKPLSNSDLATLREKAK